MSSEGDINTTFGRVIDSTVRKRPRETGGKKKSAKKDWTEDENYIRYEPRDKHTEAGYSLNTGFSAQASGAVLDLTGDEDIHMRRKKGIIRWDNKTKKYVRDQDDKKRIKTESGVYISATYKTNRYEKWKERSKQSQQGGGSDDEDASQRTPLPANHPAMKKAQNAVPKRRKGPNFEIQRPEQILKKRNEEEKRAARISRKAKAKRNKKKNKGQ